MVRPSEVLRKGVEVVTFLHNHYARKPAMRQKVEQIAKDHATEAGLDERGVVEAVVK
jgi:hypothetical protein